MTSSLLVVVGADVVRPSPEWLLTGEKNRKLVRYMVLRAATGWASTGAGDCVSRIRRSDRTPWATSCSLRGDHRCQDGTLADTTVGDVLEILDARYAVRGRTDSASATFRILRDAEVRRRHADVAGDPRPWSTLGRQSSSTVIRSRAD
jgi:hypothetical protein